MSKLSKLILRDFMNPKANIRQKLPKLEKMKHIEMKNMHFQGTRCSWCFQGPVLVQLCVASSKVACVAWVAVSVSDASGRSGASKKRPRKQASINESSCEIRKTQIYKSPKQNWFESVFSKKCSASNHISVSQASGFTMLSVQAT